MKPPKRRAKPIGHRRIAALQANDGAGNQRRIEKE
jgi:hypothetical protein